MRLFLRLCVFVCVCVMELYPNFEHGLFFNLCIQLLMNKYLWSFTIFQALEETKHGKYVQ